MDLNQLRTLIHVADLGSLSKAADRLRIAQPALSRQVRLLEDELGVRLFDRHGRGMVLTEAGRDALRHAERVMGEIEELRASMGEGHASLRGHVAVGMPPTASDVLSEPLVSAFVAAHPDATLRIVSAYSGHLLDWLRRGEIDAAILYDPQSARTLRLSPLLDEALFLIGPAQSALSLQQPAAFASLAGQRLLLPSRGHGLRDIVERCAAACGVTLDVRIEADSYTTLKGLVRGGLGLTVLPLAPLRDELRSGALTAAPLVDPVPTRRLVMAYPTDRAPSRLARFAGDAIAATLANLAARDMWASGDHQPA
jgi:DNA-binding transcriptional LysR family regulator